MNTKKVLAIQKQFLNKSYNIGTEIIVPTKLIVISDSTAEYALICEIQNANKENSHIRSCFMIRLEEHIFRYFALDVFVTCHGKLS
jgi:hypothetical protein